jgi:hypothetical protein
VFSKLNALNPERVNIQQNFFQKKWAALIEGSMAFRPSGKAPFTAQDKRETI